MVGESPRYSKHGFAVDKARQLFQVLLQMGGLFAADQTYLFWRLVGAIDVW